MLRFLIASIAIATCAEAVGEQPYHTDYSKFVLDVRSNDARGMIVLTAPGCAPCARYKNELSSNARQLRQRGLIVCVLDTTDPKNKAVVDYVKKQYPNWKGQVPATVVTDKEAKTGIGLSIGFMLIKQIFAWIHWLL